MRSKLLLLAAPILAVLLFVAATRYTNASEKEKILMKVIMDGLSEMHFSPGQIDDAFSQKVYNLYLSRMDYNKRLFTQEDIVKFDLHKDQLDDEIKAGDLSLFEIASARWTERVNQVESFYTEILSQPFDFNVKESYESDPEKQTFAANDAELKDRWRQLLKLQTLDEALERLERQEAAKKDGTLKEPEKTMEQFEKEAREKLLVDYQKWLKRMTQTTREDQVELFFNCITGAFDPHTSYFSPTDKDNFDIGMSGKLEGIGAQLREEDGYTKVTNVVPGSPSWKQGELKENDLIIKVAQGEQEPVNVVDMRLDDVVKLIRGPKGTEVRLTVKKPDGTSKVITLIRDVVIMDEGFAKSTIITDKKTHYKMGFIHLPKFYADFDDPNGRRCSKDVKAEIIKLRDEKVDGIVIDLRSNGGGSLNDVVDMSGYFIKEGPIVQVKSRQGAPYVYYDRDPRVEFDGPLVILVNGFSASASEIMAAALQDYGRAVIVGDPSTFGKGTVQRFIQLDDAVRNADGIKPLGELKVTMQKFFRINGGSTQLRGVVPDIILPDVYNYVDVGEKEEDNPMVWTEIQPTQYNKTNSIKNMDALRRKSQKRVKGSETFRLIEEHAQYVKQSRDASVVPLSLSEYRSYEDARKANTKKYENYFKENTNIELANIPSDEAGFKDDDKKKARFEQWHKDLKKDPYVSEALSIIQDMAHGGIADKE